MQVSHIPEENGEGMQVLHYVNGQKYEPHHDYFHDTVNPQKSNGGQRVATMLMYLTTVEEGGETVFPNSAEKVEGEQWSECARRGLAVKTQKGDALLFFRYVCLTSVCSVKHWLSRFTKKLRSSCSGRSFFYMQCTALPVKIQKGDAFTFYSAAADRPLTDTTEN